MKITQLTESHIDHNLTPAQLAWVLSQEGVEGSVEVVTLVLPFDLGTLPCALYGPLMGDRKIPNSEVVMSFRGERKGKSRIHAGKVRRTRWITIVSGPGPDGGCVLYTSYGGPEMPREPFEFSDDDMSEDAVESREKWSVHALCE